MAFSPCIFDHSNVLIQRLTEVQPQRHVRTRRHRPPLVAQIVLTIDIKVTISRHDHLSGRYSPNPLSGQETLPIDLHLFESNPDQVRQLVASTLTRFKIQEGQPGSENIILQIMEAGLTIKNLRRPNMGPEILPLRSEITGFVLECVPDVDDLVDESETTLMRTIVAESEREFEANNCGMIPAKRSSINKMLKKVKREDGQDCMICLGKLRQYAARMPCSHTFHFKCVKTWLKQSHKCPVCRYEMPT